MTVENYFKVSSRVKRLRKAALEYLEQKNIVFKYFQVLVKTSVIFPSSNFDLFYKNLAEAGIQASLVPPSHGPHCPYYFRIIAQTDLFMIIHTTLLHSILQSVMQL
jgi:hypothetical protein